MGSETQMIRSEEAAYGIAEKEGSRERGSLASSRNRMTC